MAIKRERGIKGPAMKIDLGIKKDESRKYIGKERGDEEI
jgi:hypothetical protein